MLSFSPSAALCGLMLLSTAYAQSALSISYCSSQNTGSANNVGSNVYNTIGSCRSKCQVQSYTFAIVQGSGCWCSNDKPSSQEAVASCKQPCPGYPSQTCGDTGAGFFGYAEAGMSGATTTVTASLASDTSRTQVISTTTSPANVTVSGSSATSSPTSTVIVTPPGTGALNPVSGNSSSTTPVPFTGAAEKMFNPVKTMAMNSVLGLALGCVLALGV